MATIEIKIPDWLDKICAWPVMVYRRHKYGYTFRKITLDEGRFVIVDQSVFYCLNRFHWCVDGKNGQFYAVRNVVTNDEKTSTVRMHRIICNAPPDRLVDHRNGNGLDNRLDNLRIATHSQNQWNKRKTKSKTSSRFIGVYFYKRLNRWVARICFKGKDIYLGSFLSEIAAAKAYDAAAQKYHGEFARLNFSSEAKTSAQFLTKPGREHSK